MVKQKKTCKIPGHMIYLTGTLMRPREEIHPEEEQWIILWTRFQKN